MAEANGARGPSLGESLLTHRGPGEVVSITPEFFVVRLQGGGGVLVETYLYDSEKDGKYARRSWDCGEKANSLWCFLVRGHEGPHLFKLP